MPTRDMTLLQAARSLSLAKSTVIAQRRNGVLAATMQNGAYRVAVAEVERYRREHLGRRTGGRPRKTATIARVHPQ